MNFFCPGVRSALLTITALSYSGAAIAHSLGGDADAGPTPPLKEYLEDAKTLNQGLPNGIGVRGVLDQFKLWPAGAPVVACFNNGERALREIFAQTSRRWLTGTSLKIDFGNAPA